MNEQDLTLRRLIDVGRALVSELDPEAVLTRILSEAREITGARYAALGVLNARRDALERFITSGLDEQTVRAIGPAPRGRGVLGVLIREPRPLRLPDVGSHLHSFGFPENHPPMRGFLGVPIIIRGQAWGNLYLCEKTDTDEFSPEDEDAATVLAQWAATAISNARLYETSESKRLEAERAVRALQAAQDIADAIGSVDDLREILEVIVRRGRSLVDAQSVLILLREGEELVVAASAGHVHEALGRRIPLHGSTSGQVLMRGQAQRVSDAAADLAISPTHLGVTSANAALLVPMFHRGAGVGVLAAFDRGADGDSFQLADEQVLRAFAASAANAVAIKRSVEADRLRAAIEAAEAERSRWARELHDQTLQTLGGLRVMISSALRRADAEGLEPVMRQAIADIELETANLRGIIADLRPSALDDLGLVPALHALIERRRGEGLEIAAEIELAEDGARSKLQATLETTVYRLVQESLTNVVKHSDSHRCKVQVTHTDGELRVCVSDEGSGYDTSAQTAGFGIAGMRERVYLAGGDLRIRSGPGGTLVEASFPAL